MSKLLLTSLLQSATAQITAQSATVDCCRILQKQYRFQECFVGWDFFKTWETECANVLQVAAVPTTPAVANRIQKPTSAVYQIETKGSRKEKIRIFFFVRTRSSRKSADWCLKSFIQEIVKSLKS